ncbi:MAG TPA: N-acetyltransferase [Albitalea sp.]|uniref:GNAT family N-acetyltransferase n=1 Tax=Piscinibacter sp. TaxID=1903157 RepID=UPI002ED5402F
MSDSPQIRALLAADLPAYKALRDEMLALHPEAFTSDAETERAKPATSYLSRIGAERADEAFFVLGAWDGDALIGAIACERDPRLKVRHIGHLVGMMVRAGARGRGVGRALLEACVARARRVPHLEMLTLTVTSTNAAAVGLYEAIGFKHYGRLVHAMKLGDTYHDKDLMVLAL